MSENVFDTRLLETQPDDFCGQCKRIFSDLEKDTGSSWRDKRRSFKHESIGKPKNNCVLCARLRTVASEWYLKFYTLEGEGQHHFLPSLRLAPDSNAESIYTEARNHMATCLTSHKRCRRNIEGTEHPDLPTRVIDIGASSSSAPRLLITSRLGAITSAPYACLSYCWGGDQLKTTVATVEKHTSALPVAELSKTVQDAMMVTRRMGLRYLWVDALCIIQDDPVDKGKEIVQMGDIYKNASLTISVGSTATASEGFLDRPAKQPNSVALLVRLPSQAGESPSDARMCKIYATAASSFVWNGHAYLKHNPLETRGWVMQESLLSTRMLIFGSMEVVWHCQTGNAATSLVHGSLMNLWERRESRLPPGSSGAGGLMNGLNLLEWVSQTPLGRPKQMADTWKPLVKNYTDRGLTEKNDRIAAMAGIVGELQRVWNDRYCFGLWERLGPSGLCWTIVNEPGDRLPIAPTWSWCSVQGQVWWYPPVDCDVSIVMFPSASNPAAAMDPEQRVVLKVRGKVIPPHEIPQLPDESHAEVARYMWFFDTNDAPRDIRAYHLLYMGNGSSDRPSLNSRTRRMNFVILCHIEETTFKKVGMFLHSAVETAFSSNSPFYKALKTCSKRTIDLI